MSFGHVNWDFDSHAFIFLKSYFFGSKSENMNYFYFQESTVLPQNFLCRLTTQFCQLYRKAFAKSLRFFRQNQKVIQHIFFSKTSLLQKFPGQVKCIFDSPVKKCSRQGLHDLSPNVRRIRYLWVFRKKKFPEKFIWIPREQAWQTLKLLPRVNNSFMAGNNTIHLIFLWTHGMEFWQKCQNFYRKNGSFLAQSPKTKRKWTISLKKFVIRQKVHL